MNEAYKKWDVDGILDILINNGNFILHPGNATEETKAALQTLREQDIIEYNYTIQCGWEYYKIKGKP